ncbi:MAG TPA: pyridoxamine 5'-phosphate oxidase family protein [Candidatus Dormibacteraeota bacterium]|jgi:nitroimidazol reductase NimA-like FMN-containing flavoprotein (pyridoxamine 5'-phosphate oxidase superfamily)
MDIDPEGRRLLTEPNIGNLGFHGIDGYPRVIPVWFKFTGDEIQVASPPNLYKSRALRADPQAVLMVSTPKQPYHVVSATGRVDIEVIEEPERIVFVREVADRYLGPDAGSRYIEAWIRGGHPGPGDLLRLKIERLRYTNVGGD